MDTRLIKLLDYIEEFHSWKNMHTYEGVHVIPKYFTLTFDTRDMECWQIHFYNIMGYKRDEITFRLETEKDYDKVYHWLESGEDGYMECPMCGSVDILFNGNSSDYYCCSSCGNIFNKKEAEN